jgi:hypothetical protein
MTSKYNIIRFVLDEAYEDRTNRPIQTQNWVEWFLKVSRMFNHKIPDSLLEALSKKNEPLELLVEEYRKKARPKPSIDAHAIWIQRRDAGNARALAKKQQEAKRIQQESKEIKLQQQETYERQMKPIWDKQYENILYERDSQIDLLFSSIEP